MAPSGESDCELNIKQDCEMYLLPLLAFIGSAVAVPVSNTVPTARAETNEELAARYVLPTNTIPSTYDVSLFFNPDDESGFNGKVTMRIIPMVNTSQAVMHAMEMNITKVEVYSDREPTVNIFANFTHATDDTHFLRINVAQMMMALQPHIIVIEYVGHYSENMFGVYVSRYFENGQTRKLITSQLQPTYARRVYPCYDEPYLRARITTTIYAPAAYTVVRSNMPLKETPVKPDVQGWVKHEFAETLPMSTYLGAYLVSNFQNLNNTANPIYKVPFRVYSRPEALNTASFALEYGQQNMVALENYTEFEYAFPKLDKVAVPDFAAGAMENWGLVIYREVALLVQDGVTTTSTKQGIGRIICHENVHQWFGNEVSPMSWTYTWLNEGFANFFESFGTDLVLPGWRMMDQFVLNMQNVFQSDAVLSVNPMTHPVFSPSQVISTFNSVAYQKSGSVIRMMQHFLTPEVFRKGLVIYVRDMSRRSAVPADLYRALQQALNQSNHSIPYPVATVMDRWVNQGGFPVLDVMRSAPTAQSITVAQVRYLTDRNQSSSNRWHVPVNWVLSTNPDFSDTSPQGWVPPSFPAVQFQISGLPNAEWYIVNKQQTGYYRVNYENSNWAALARALIANHSVIHLLNRANILDDVFNLARNGRVNYGYALNISRYLVNETDYIPWGAVNPAYTYLGVVLAGSPVYNLYEYYLLNMTALMYQRLGFTAAAGEEHVTPFFRNVILNLNCRHGNAACINTAAQLLQNFRNNTSQRLDPDIQTVVYCSGLRGGDTGNFDFLWEMYQNSSDSSEQSILLNSLGCTSNEEKRNFYMNQVISDNSLVREQDRHTILVSIVNSSPAGSEAALTFLINNFEKIRTRIQLLSGMSNILTALANRLSTQAHLNQINRLENDYNAILTAAERAGIANIRENIAASIAWNNLHAPVVEEWLRVNYSGAPSLVAGLLVLLSVLLTILNY